MIHDIDKDGSGTIEFSEFLDIIKGSNSKRSKSNKLYDFFKGYFLLDLINFSSKKNPISRQNSVLPFDVIVSQKRREILMVIMI